MVTKKSSLSELEKAVLGNSAIDRETAVGLNMVGILMDDVSDFIFEGMTVDDIKTYAQLGFTSKKDIIYFGRRRESLLNLQIFSDLGITEPAHLRSLIEKDVNPIQALPYIKAGIKRWIPDLMEIGIEPDMIVEYKSVGIDAESRIVEFFKAGISPTLVREYQEAGINPPNSELVDLVKHNISPIKAQNLVSQGLSVHTISYGLKLGIEPERLIPYIEAGITEQIGLLRLVEEDIPVEEVKQWQGVVNDRVIVDFIEEGISQDDARSYTEVGIWIPSNVRRCIETSLSPEYFSELAKIGFKIDFVNSIIDNPVPIDVARGYIKYGIESLADIALLHKKLIPASIAVQYLTPGGFPYLDADAFIRHNVSPEEFREFASSQPETYWYSSANDPRMELIVRRRFLDELKEKYGIDESTHKRYSFDVLEHLVKVRKEGIQPAKRTALFVNPKSDWNGAFGNTSIENQVVEHYNTLVTETDEAVGVSAALKRYAEQHGKIDLLVLSGHGTETTIRFGFNNGEGKLSSDNLSTLRGSGQYLSDDAIVVLRSCSTGKSRLFQKSIGQRLANVLGKTVYAPVEDSKTESLLFDESKRVIDVKYNVPHAVYNPNVFRRTTTAILSCLAA